MRQTFAIKCQNFQKYLFYIGNIGNKNGEIVFSNIGAVWAKCKHSNVESIFYSNITDIKQNITMIYPIKTISFWY